jgi:WD40 repeat protein
MEDRLIIVKPRGSYALLRSIVFQPLGFLLLLSLITGCIPSVSTNAATVPSTPVFLPTPTQISTLQKTDSASAFTATPAHAGPALKFNAWEIVHDIAYSPDGQYLAVSAGTHVHIFNSGNLAEIADIQAGAWASRIAFHPGLPLIMLAVKDGAIQILEILSGALVCQFTAHEKGAHSLSIHPDGGLLVTTGADITSGLWDTASIKNGDCTIDEIGTFIGESYNSPDAAFSPDGKSIALVDLSNIRLRKTSDRKLIALLECEIPIYDIAFSPDGRWLAAAQQRDSVTLWDLTHAGNPAAVILQPSHPDIEAYTWRVAFSPDSKLLAAGNSNGSITIQGLADLSAIETFYLSRAASALAFSPDGKILAAGGLDASVWFFPVAQK